MTTFTPDELARLARGLTTKQWNSIVNAKDMMSNHGGYAFLTVHHTGELWPMGIAEFLTLKTDRLTPLGLALRDWIKENEGG
jgi:hypothetical protein